MARSPSNGLWVFGADFVADLIRRVRAHQAMFDWLDAIITASPENGLLESRL